MTLINRLVWQARHGATDLVITERDVSKVAQHIMTTMHLPPTVTKAEVVQFIHENKVVMCGVPVRVLQ